MSSKLADLALDELVHLQEEGPTDQDIATILEIDQRAHENGLQENYFWLERILRSYQSRAYSGDVGTSFKVQDEGRSKFRESLTPPTAQSALQRILPYPCKNQYTIVILMPQASRFKFLRSLFQQNAHCRDAKILTTIARITAMVASFWRYSRKS